MTIAEMILSQLGGKRFVAMTGSNSFVCSETWLRMNLAANKSGVNRLKVTLCADDTYTMEFYHQTISKKTFEVKTTKQKTFDGVYWDMLQGIFTEVTGMYTTL